ncbi:MAG: hypothetical protein CMIDDMOC_00680 [Sodalis sp. Fle]|nr:MAG: hypothetical protein CMIDDMOC_00680 [Sodalis sp. Fle]
MVLLILLPLAKQVCTYRFSYGHYGVMSSKHGVA